MDARRYYACRVRFDGAPAFLIGYADDRDGFVRDPDARLVAAPTADALAEAAAARGLALEPGAPDDHDLDALRAWCADPDPARVDPPRFLDAWNVFDDLARLYERTGSPYTRLSRRAEGCYDKLFRALRPAGGGPAWRPDELALLRRVFRAGLARLRAELSAAGVGGGPRRGRGVRRWTRRPNS